jgi:prepilin-type N-terminal cleavage/methylation domain-containing protein
MITKQRGYNLVELMIAMAVLAVVMVSIMTLFVLGRKNVYSGQQMSRANAVAVNVLEDLSFLTLSEVVTEFELDGDDPITLRTDDADDDDLEYVGEWKELVAPSSGQKPFTDGYVQMEIIPVDGAFDVATVLRITVTVAWKEGRRERSVVMTTAKAQND